MYYLLIGYVPFFKKKLSQLRNVRTFTSVNETGVFIILEILLDIFMQIKTQSSNVLFFFIARDSCL